MPLSPIQTLAVIGVVVVSALTLLGRQRRTVRGLRLPPGPVPLPLVGNFLSIDTKKPWATYAEWATRYGDIFTIRLLKQDVIMINSKKIARELLDRRSSIYSDRPHLASKDPYGWSFNFAWTPYGEKWRSQRRLFHQAFRAEASLAFRPVQLRKTRQLLSDIFDAPGQSFEHLLRFAAGVVLSIVYDYDVGPGHDHFVEILEPGCTLAMEGLLPELSSIIDAFPSVLRFPGWFPGSFLGRKAATSKRCAMQILEEPFEHTRKRETMSDSASAFALDLFRAIKDVDDPSQLQLLKETYATAFVAGAETTSSTLHCFILAMLQHPEVQERAHAEIDAVIGPDRLPNFEDRPNLPYVEAILLETLRFYVLTPLGLPHATTTDDVYEDIFIPKGSTLVANIWAINHDEDAYPEHDIFKPERFFVDGKLKDEKSIDNLAFGFGRRICPGRYTADASIWIAMVSILSIFKITNSVDERGKEIECEPTFTTGVVTAPHPFSCTLKLRSSNIDIHKLLMADAFD